MNLIAESKYEYSTILPTVLTRDIAAAIKIGLNSDYTDSLCTAHMHSTAH